MLDSEESIELDRMTMKALRLLDEHGGVATTSELKNVMGLDDTDDLNYRKREYLEPAGLIETHQPKPDSPGKFPPAEWRLTEKGSGVVDELQSEETDRRDIAERVELFFEQLNPLCDVPPVSLL